MLAAVTGLVKDPIRTLYPVKSPNVPTLVTFHLFALKLEALVAFAVPVLVSNASTINSTPPVEAIEIGKYLPFLPTGNNLFCVLFASALLA